MYNLLFSFAAKEDILRISRENQKRILDKLDFFLEQKNPLEYAKKLTGTKNRYRFRIGDYRVIFTKKENGKCIILLILKIAHRKEIYE